MSGSIEYAQEEIQVSNKIRAQMMHEFLNQEFHDAWFLWGLVFDSSLGIHRINLSIALYCIGFILFCVLLFARTPLLFVLAVISCRIIWNYASSRAGRNFKIIAKLQEEDLKWKRIAETLKSIVINVYKERGEQYTHRAIHRYFQMSKW